MSADIALRAEKALCHRSRPTDESADIALRAEEAFCHRLAQQKERVMWLAAMQLISGRTWQDNRERIAAELASLPGSALAGAAAGKLRPLWRAAGYLDGAEPLGNGPIQQQLSDWAKSHGIWLVAGAMPTAIAGADHIHTSTLVFDPDGELKGITTRSTCSTWTWRTITAATGSRRPSARVISLCWWTPLGPLGLSICYDLRFPELYRQLAPGRCPGAAGACRLYRRHRRGALGALLRARAIENQCYVVAANQGHPRDRAPDLGPQHGDRPWGRVLACRASGRALCWRRWMGPWSMN